PAGGGRRAGAGATVAAEGAQGPGDDLPEVPAKGAGEALRRCYGSGGRPAALPGGRADRGAAGEPGGAELALVSAESGDGGAGGLPAGGADSRRAGFDLVRPGGETGGT